MTTTEPTNKDDRMTFMDELHLLSIVCPRVFVGNNGIFPKDAEHCNVYAAVYIDRKR